MFYGKSWDDWIAQYATSHTHPINRWCHTIGIPLVAVSIVLLLLSLVVHGLWTTAISLFLLGWLFQFIGHAFERKMPEFFKDWRFLFVGLRWCVQKMKEHIKRPS